MAGKDTDTRIVEMQFDAKDFDKNIRNSQKNLEDFKKSLNFDDAAKQMSAITEGGNDLGATISGMAKNIAKLAKEFTGIGSLSTFVAQKIKTAWHGALNSVERFTKSLTSDQITEGSQKYDKLLKSVQTIMNATGDSEQYVYQVMERLNHYTDETSYNFSDMAQNIGKFTTAGVNLKDAEEEMEGIANWAALAGQGVNEASRAMYNISQAMSAGYMQKIDWKSIQNANMDTRAFRKEALEAAVAAGTLKKSKDGLYKTVKGNKQVDLNNFAETLQYKWFDKKTMETVFKTFADNTKGIGLEAYKAAQRCTTLSDAINAWKDMLSTGWMKSYEHVFGKLSDAMALFSGLCNKVSESLSKLVEIRNGILERWSVGGGRDSLWGALFGELESPDGETLFKGAYGLLDAMQSIGDAIREAFWDFVGKFISPENQALFNQDKEGRGIEFLASKLTVLTSKVQEFTGKIHDFLYSTDPGETESRFDRIKHVAETVFAVITLIVDVVKGIAQFAGEIGKQLYPAFHSIELLVDGLLQMFTGKVAEGAKNNTIGNFFHNLAELLKPVTTIINVVVSSLSAFIAKFVVMLKQSGAFEMFGNIFKHFSTVFMNFLTKVINSGILQKAFAWIQNGISKIPGLIQRIRDFGAVLLTTAKNSKAVSGIKGFFGKLFNGKSLKDVLKNLKTNLSGLIKKIPEILPSLKSGLSTVFSKISEFIGNLFSGIFGLGESKAEGSEEITESIASAIAKPIEALGKGDVVGKAIDKAKPGFLDNLKTKISEIWGSITGFFTSLGNSEGFQKIKKFFAGTDFQTLLGGAKDILKWLAIFRTGSGLVSIGKGAKQLGKGIKVFGKNLKNLNLKDMFSNMFNISNIINSNNTDNSKRTDFSKLGNQFLQIAAAIGIIAASAYVLAKLNVEELKQAGISLGIIIAALLGAGFLAKKFTGNGGSLMALALGVLMLLVPLKILQKMAWSTLADGVLKLAAVMFSLALAMRLAGNTKAKGFISMATALTLLLIPLNILAKMPIMTKSDWSGGLIQGIMALEALMFSIAVALRIAGNTKAKGFLSIAVALTVMMIPIKMLGNMDLGKAAQGVVGIILILGSLTAMIKITDGCDKTKLAGIVGAITALAAVGWLIGHTMNWKQALVGFAPLILMILSMSLMFKTASNLDENQMKALKAIFIAFTVTIAIIAGAIVALSAMNVDWGIVAAFFAGIILILVAMGAMLKLASKTDAKGISKTALVLGLISGLVAVAGGALVDLSKQKADWGTILAFLGGLAALIGVLGLVMPALSKLSVGGILKGTAALFAGVTAILGAVALMLPVVMGSLGNSMVTMAAKMKTMGGLLQGFFEKMSAIGEGAVNHAITVFDGIKTILGRFSGFASMETHIRSVMSQLNYLGAGLDAFFVNEGKYPDPETSKTFKIINKFIEIGPSLSAFSIGTLPEQLMYLGVGLRLFDEATKTITSVEPPALGLLRGIFGQADNIEKFTKLPLESFRSQMSGLGGAMSLYAKGAKEVTGLTKEGGKAPDISDSISILKAVCSAISGEDDGKPFEIPSNMPDSTALGLFAGNLEALGTALSTFATAAHDMETDTSKASALLAFLAEIGGYVTPENLKVVDAFDEVGHADASGNGGKLGQFALDISALGTALSTFAQDIGGKEADFTTGLGILDHFEELNQKLTASRLDFVKAFTNAGLSGGENGPLGQFATDIGALGHALATFAQNATMDDGTQADFDYALKALDFLSGLEVKLSAIKLDGLKQIIEGNSATLGTLATDVQQLGQALCDFSSAITGATEGTDPFNAEAALATMDVLAKMIGIINAINIDHAGEWTSPIDKAYQLVDFFSILFDDGDGLQSRFADGSMIAAFAKFAQDLSTVFKNTEGIDTAAIDMFQKLSDGLASLMLMDTSMNFEYPGQMISEGIARGIENGRSRVVSAIISVVQAGITAGNQTAGINSPSRVFAEMGEYMNAGLVKGLTGTTDNVESASGAVAQAAVDNALNLMALISQAMAESIDMQPTITPVLDLSNVTGAGSVLDNIFSGYSLNIGSALDRAVAATSGSGGPSEVVVQNPTDLSGVQGSIQALQTQIVGLQSAISNMKIILNTGVVAGGVTDDVDRNLGRKNLYASRRN